MADAISQMLETLMNRVSTCALAGLLALNLVACGKNTSKSTSANQASGASETSGTQAPQDDEAAVLAAPQFTAGITLWLASDGSLQANRLAAMNGVDARPLYGAAYATDGYTPCYTQGMPSVAAGVKEYNVSPDTVEAWLWKEGLIELRNYEITYTNAQMPQAYGTINIFKCALVSQKFADALPPGQRGADVHGGINVQLAKRVFDKWTFENRYETQVPGKGNVKVFAGTLSYHMATNYPGVSFSGAGTASVKAFLNPDTGKWEVASFQLSDPPLTLTTQ